MGDAPAHRSVSLGAAIVGGAPAPGFQAPEDSVPGSWVEVFRKHYADHGVLTGLMQSCTAGRDWALTFAPKARLTVSTKPRDSLEAWQAGQEAAVQRAALRGSQPTALAVVVHGSEFGVAALNLLPHILRVAGPHYTELALSVADGKGGESEALQTVRAGPAITHFLSSAALWNVTHVSLNVPCDFALPPPNLPQPPKPQHLIRPSSFSSLKHVTVTLPKKSSRKVTSQLWNPVPGPPHEYEFPGSLSGYLPQVQVLKVRGVSHSDKKDGTHNPWPLLFTPAARGYALTSFTTDGDLTGALLRGLVQSAPALKTLRVYEALGGDPECSKQEWALESLESGWEVHASALACLPRPRDGCVTQVTGTLLNLVVSAGVSVSRAL